MKPVVCVVDRVYQRSKDVFDAADDLQFISVDQSEAQVAKAIIKNKAIATILGLRHTYNTVVGDSMLRGVSGGERKRVSIGEVLAARAKIVMFGDFDGQFEAFK